MISFCISSALLLMFPPLLVRNDSSSPFAIFPKNLHHLFERVDILRISLVGSDTSIEVDRELCRHEMCLSFGQDVRSQFVDKDDLLGCLEPVETELAIGRTSGCVHAAAGSVAMQSLTSI